MVLAAVLWLGAFHWPEQVDSRAPAATAAENSSKRTATLAVLAGLIALGGLIVSVSNYRRQAKHDAHVHEKDRQDLVHQRYSTAIAHLGSGSAAIQAAAIYALEDVIKADPERRAAIVQTLVALMADVRAELEAEAEPGHPAVPDVRAIAGQVVIARQREQLGAPPAWLRSADLRSLDLSNANLAEADLANADLSGADLTSANLDAANLEGATLERALLVGADLFLANLNNAQCLETDLSGTNLGGARLERAQLWHTRLVGSDLRDAHLDGAVIVGADLQGSDLAEASLRTATLSDSNLAETNLTGANLTGTNLATAASGGPDVDLPNVWRGANVWDIKGMPRDWHPPGAIQEPPDQGEVLAMLKEAGVRFSG